MRSIIVVLIIGTILVGCFSQNSVNLLPMEEEALSTRVVQSADNKGTENKILILDIDGVLQEEGCRFFMLSEEPMTVVVKKKLNKALKDDDIKAVVLRINSPGGTVTASDIIYKEIKTYKQKAKVPVVAVLMGTAASGGYYTACSADRIIAHPTTITGSIGVLVASFGFNGLFQKIGMESRVVKSGPLKDIGNPFDEFTPEERAVFQNIVDQFYDRFLDVVAEGRQGLTKQEVAALSDGRIFTAKEALEKKLIDRIGYLDDSIEEAKRLAHIRDARVIIYSNSWRKENNVYSTSASTTAPSFNVSQQMLENIIDQSKPKFLYMYMGQ